MEDTSQNSKQVTVVAQEGCPPCHTVIEYLKWKNIKHDVVYIGEDISWHLFVKFFPFSEGTPHCLVDGKEIPDLIAYFESGLE